MPRVVFFDVAADDPERAIGFYRDVFGWKIERWPGPMEYYLITTGGAAEPGIDGGLARRSHPSERITPVIQVPSADRFAAKVVAGGGKITRPKLAIPGVGYLVSCEDTEGNAFALMESDLAAPGPQAS